jgi:RNA polymerase sigma factor (sigma-70 family)
MPAGPAAVLRHLRRRLEIATPDGDLLRAYAEDHSEAAFRALVERHGPMVLGLCRRRLGDAHAAEDAFQATFLVLARAAGSVRRPDAVAAWLYGAAERITRKARAADRRRQRLDARGARTLHRTPDPAAALTGRELLDVLDEELHRLPDRYRLPLWLVFWQGLTQDEAARRLGCSPGSVKGRLERGRRHLADRLRRRGLAPPAVLLAPLALAAVPAGLLAGTAALAAAPWSNALPAAVLALASAAAPPKVLPAVVLAAAVLGAGVLGLGAGAPQPAEPPNGEAPPPAAAAVPRVDRYGDPLPSGAIRRFGTARFRLLGGFVLSPDGTTLASSGRTIGLWDAATGKPRGVTPMTTAPFHTSTTPVAFTPDSTRLVVLGPEEVEGQGRLVVWDVATLKSVHSLQPGGRIEAAALSPDGGTVAVRDPNGALRLLDVDTGGVRRDFGRQGGGPGMAFSPDGRLFAAVAPKESDQGSIQVWDAATGEPRLKVTGGAWGWPPFAFAPDGATLATAQNPADRDGNGTIHLWDVAAGRETWSLTAPGGAVSSLAFAPDGRTLASTARDGTATFWDAATGRIVRRISDPEYPICGVTFAPGGRAMYTRNDCGLVRAWEVATGRPTVAYDQHGWLTDLALSPDGRTMVTAGYSEVRLWDRTTGRVRTDIPAHVPFRDRRHNGRDYINSVSFTPDGRSVVTSRGDGAVRVWDIATGQEVRRLDHPDPGFFTPAALSPDGRLLAVGGKTEIRLWDLTTGRLAQSFGGYKELVTALTFSPDGAYLASVAPAAGDGGNIHRMLWGSVRVRSVASGQEVFRRDQTAYPSGFSSPVFTPDDRGLAGVDHGAIRVLDFASQQRRGPEWANLHAVIASPDRAVLTMAASPGGAWLATSHQDGTVRLRDHLSGREVLTLRPDADEVRRLLWAPDGATLFTGNGDGTVLEWDLTPPGGPPDWSAALAPAEADQVWTDLASADAGTAYRAYWRLACAGNAVAVFRDRLRPAANSATTERVNRLIADLDHDRFAVREAASRELIALGEKARPTLTRALRQSKSPETLARAKSILGRLPPEPLYRPVDLRRLRALEALRRHATPAARDLLAELKKE